jgi:uncharacterized protein (DUF433 family)
MENHEHIEKKPGVCGGRACIAGHRIRVADVVAWHERRGYCPEEIVDMFPGITLSDVYAALAYYFDNRDEIEADIRASDDWSATPGEAGWLRRHGSSWTSTSLRP